MKNIRVLLSVCFVSTCFASGNEEVTPLNQATNSSQIATTFEEDSQSQSDLSESEKLPDDVKKMIEIDEFIENGIESGELFKNFRESFERVFGGEFSFYLDRLGIKEKDFWGVLQGVTTSFKNDTEREYFSIVEHFVENQ